MKVQEFNAPPRAASVVTECVKSCIESNYAWLYDKAIDAVNDDNNNNNNSNGNNSNILDSGENSTGPHTLDFWLRLIRMVVGVIEEDRDVYTQVLNQ